MSERAHDRGNTFLEVLLAITITGLLMTGILAALRTTVDASTLDRDHANAHAWLQTATDVLYQAELEDCGTQAASAEPAVRAAYQAIVRSTSNPKGWPEGNIEILAPVLFWDGRSSYQSTCYDDIGISLQLITIQVRGLDGRIVESVQVVKG
jgi:type II secretory pathway pseudopilin PulG